MGVLLGTEGPTIVTGPFIVKSSGGRFPANIFSWMGEKNTPGYLWTVKFRKGSKKRKVQGRSENVQ